MKTIALYTRNGANGFTPAMLKFYSLLIFALPLLAQVPMAISRLPRISVNNGLNPKSLLEPLLHDVPSYAQNVSPFGHALNFASEFNQNAVDSIPCLFERRGPSEISNQIALCGVYSVESFSFWPVAHQRVKKLEGSELRAKSEDAVFCIALGFGVTATLEHCNPAFMGTASVFSVSSVGARNAVTTARCCPVAAQAHGKNVGDISTVALAYPSSTWLASDNLRFPALNHEKFSEPLTPEVA